MSASLDQLATSPIIESYHSGKTTLLFTQKALTHILDQHSETFASEKAKAKGKVCFSDQQEVIDISTSMLPVLTSEIEFNRSNGIYIPYSKTKNQISYFPMDKKLMIQINPLAKIIFELVSFYKIY